MLGLALEQDRNSQLLLSRIDYFAIQADNKSL